MEVTYGNNVGQWIEFSKERPMYIYGFNPRGFSKGENLYAQFQFDGPSKFKYQEI